MTRTPISASSTRDGRFLRVTLMRSLFASMMIASMSGCYHWRIDESYWLHARPGPAVDSARALAGLPSEYVLRRLSIPVGDSTVLAGVAAIRPGASTTVLYFGGSDFVLARGGLAVLHALTVAPVNVVILDYPASGVSTGRLTLPAVEGAAVAAFDWVAARRDLAPAGVVVHGHSMGSFVAAAVADTRAVRGLVLQNSATNPSDWVHEFLQPSRFKWWARLAYPFIRISVAPSLAGEDNAARVRRYRGPLLILSGSLDEQAAPVMSRALAEASATPDSLKQLVILAGAGHENMLEHPDFAPAYRTFIATVAHHYPPAQ